MKRIVIAIVMLALFTSAAYGTTYRWNPNKRPPLSLAEALRRADKLLGDDAENRYCTGVVLYGNKSGDGKECYWNLYYSAADGSKKLVYIDHTGQGEVQIFNGAIDWREKPGRRTGLNDIATRLNDVLKANGYEARATVKDRKLTLRARSRTFRVYRKTESGAFGDELVDVIGPKHDGFVIDAHELDHLDREAYEVFEQGPYWNVNRTNHVLTGKDRFVKVQMRYRTGRPRSLVIALLKAFGKEAPGPFD
jgi:hypothetical protein